MTWPAKWPFSAAHLKRTDETEDASFYDTPRFVHHIDDHAQEALAKHYHHIFTEGAEVLDLCSSWVSHFPSEEIGPVLGDVVGLGMSELELKENKRLSRFVVQDLNKNPVLPFEDESFDFVVNAVSIDYLIRPLEVCTEIKRVLRPGGTAVMAFSNRCFPTKVVQVWLSVDESTRLAIVGTYFKCAGFEPDNIAGYDITDKNGNDPMYIVCATKEQTE
jgi:SAM-dependent methyltransferase